MMLGLSCRLFRTGTGGAFLGVFLCLLCRGGALHPYCRPPHDSVRGGVRGDVVVGSQGLEATAAAVRAARLCRRLRRGGLFGDFAPSRSDVGGQQPDSGKDCLSRLSVHGDSEGARGVFGVLFWQHRNQRELLGQPVHTRGRRCYASGYCLRVRNPGPRRPADGLARGVFCGVLLRGLDRSAAVSADGKTVCAQSDGVARLVVLVFAVVGVGGAGLRADAAGAGAGEGPHLGVGRPGDRGRGDPGGSSGNSSFRCTCCSSRRACSTTVTSGPRDSGW